LKIIVTFEEEFPDDDFPRKDNARRLLFIKDEDRNVATNLPEEEKERPRREEDEDNIFLFLW